jgi:hypothetical protein
MLEQGVSEASRDLVLEAAKFVTSPGFTPYFDQIENLQGARQRRNWKYSRDAYYAAPREVKRWPPSSGRKPAKQPAQMKVLAINASPRRGGNTECLVLEALRAAKDAGASGELLRLQTMKIDYCIGCRKCKKPGYKSICSIKDDMTSIYEKIIACDAMIVGFPIYTG